MGLHFMFGDIIDNIGSFTDKLDFHTELQQTAFRCAYGTAHIQDEWINMLLLILNEWDAAVKMDLGEAVDYMMSVCGYDDFGERPLFSDKSGFWFLQSEQYMNFGLDESKSKRLYCVTIAIFETINYWCWHDAPVQITFDSEGLQGVLRYGSINIDWNSYEKING